MTERERSHWAWGWADKLPNDDARRALAAQVGAMLGGDALEPRALPSLADATLPEPRVAPPAELAPFARADRDDRARHTYGRSYRDIVRAFRGDFAVAPDFVAHPRTEDDVAKVIAWCAAERVTLVPFGGGTSVVGGVEPLAGPGHRGVVSLDMRALDRVLEIDRTSRAARIQAGATGPVLEAQLAAHGYSLRHYPQSFEFATLGGMIATRAGGHFATLYTHVDDLVESVRMLTPRGPFESRRFPASGAGPSPERLVLGSEGILGVITEAWVRVQSRPRWRSSASVFFDDLVIAACGARAIAQAALFPSNCRVLDPREALINGVPTDGGAVLLLGFESADRAMNASIDRAIALAIENGGRCPGGAKHREEGERGADKTGEAWRQAFFDGPYLQSALVSLGVIADTFETACTWDRFDALYASVVDRVTAAMKRACGAGSISCRFTHVYPDGPAPYFTFVAPGRAGSELEQWALVKEAASEALLANGATITHHHAVGRTHRPWYDRERPDLFAEALRAAKRVLDPEAILNPGILIDP
jgi:alkyldihydroxyacetonephosphate synthase